MKIWNQAPLIRLLLPFLTGILAAVYQPVQFEFILPVIISIGAIVATMVFVPQLNISYKKSWWFGLLITVLLFISGYQLSILNTENFYPDHFSKLTENNSCVYGKITKPYIEKEKTLKTVLEILSVKKDGHWESASGKAMVYFQKDSVSYQLNYGDEIIVKANFIAVPPPQNPGEFDYKQFLAYHNIYQQAFIKSNEWVNNGISSGNTFINYCIRLRNNLLNILDSNHIKGDEFSVGAALLLGYEDQLDNDIISSYANTGTLHILSVSGLHVAIVYVVFNWLLFFLDKIKYGNILKASLLILFLWFYAALTGLSPSVLRAATMLSFIIIAKSFNRHTNIYNTLAASAFLLLIIDPFLIMDAGFQLSYLAVIGIVYIQPKTYAWLEISNSILNEAWKITTVSLAAQIATFPLSLFYFHQFPNYFLLSNFIVIPLSTIIIYLGIALFALAKISFAVLYLSLGFDRCVWFLNQSVKKIEQWPYALIHGISITIIETVLIYMLIVFFFYYFNKRKVLHLLNALTVFIIIMCLQVTEQYQQYQQKKLIIYNLPKTAVIDFIYGRNNQLLTDSLFAKNKNSLRFHLKPNWYNLGIEQPKIASITAKNNFVQFYNKSIIIINGNKTEPPAAPFKTDYLIISKNPRLHISDILKQYHADQIIFDSSNSSYNIKKWKKECEELKQEYYCVQEKGAFVVDI